MPSDRISLNRTPPVALGEPWAISDAGLELVIGIWSRGEVYADRIEAALAAREGKPLDNTRSVTVADGVATIPVHGPLFRHANLMTEVSGASSYETIRKDFQAAIDSDAVKAIVLDIDSPGGEVRGCSELANAIFKARGTKPITAYASGNMASAAYWIGSAADRIVADRSAIVGSIGVKCMLVDTAKADEQAGLKRYEIVSSQSPYKVVDASDKGDRDRVQSLMSRAATVFVEDVAKFRGASMPTVLSDYGQGDVMVGKQAVQAGLVDELGDMESLVAGLISENSKGILQMANKDKGEVTANLAVTAATKCSGCRSDMDDDDDMYCSSCRGSKSEHAGGISALLATTEKATIAEALATLVGWKQAASEIGAIKQQMAAQEKAARLAAFDGALEKAVVAGVIPRSPEHKRHQYAASLRDQEGGLAALNSFIEAVGSVPVAAVEPRNDKEVEKRAAATGGLTPEQLKIIKATGSDPEKVAAHRKVLAKAMNQTEEN